MSFPLQPTVGQVYTNPKGITYEWNSKGGWSIISLNNGTLKFTVDDTAPEQPALGDQW